MKTITRNLFGWSSALALLALLTSSALAGPGPQYWEQQARGRETNASQVAKTDAAKPADVATLGCASCKNTDVKSFHPGGGKTAPRSDKIGTKHECAACGGAIATVRGKTTNSMKDNCPTCAKDKTAAAPCCHLAS